MVAVFGPAGPLFAQAPTANSVTATPGPGLQGGAPPLPKLDPNFHGPLIKDTWAGDLAKQPDITGVWFPTTQAPGVPALLFDPLNAYVAPGGNQGNAGGPPPGTRIKNIPYKPEYQALYDEIVKNTEAGFSIDPIGGCRPYGIPRLMAGQPGNITIMQSPTAIVMVGAWYSEPRAIYLDGRKAPDAESELGGDQRTEHGHSLGHWEGDTLVVDTINILDGYYDQTDPPYSNQLTVNERIRLVAPDWLEEKMTMTDPVMLTRPWTVTRYFYRRPKSTAFTTFFDERCIAQDMSKGYQAPVLPQDEKVVDVKSATALATAARKQAEAAERAAGPSK
jgi:hypothetical protein